MLQRVVVMNTLKIQESWGVNSIESKVKYNRKSGVNSIGTK